MRKREVDAMKDEAGFGEAVMRALERQPEVKVPEDFATRVRAALPARAPVRVRRSFGVVAGMAAIAALVVGLCWLAPQASPSFGSVAFDVELGMLAELAGVAMWLARRPRAG